MVSLIQSNYTGFGSGSPPPGIGFGAAEPRRPLHPEAGAAQHARAGASGRCTPSSRRSCRRATCRIAFGIMGGCNQSQAHAQFVANVVDFGMNIQQALEAARFTKGTFEGCDVEIEARCRRRCAPN